MPKRIYALAKELKIDSKLLADMCTKAGITVRGSSALASLSDEEVEILNAYMKGHSATSNAPVRPVVAPDLSKPVPVVHVTPPPPAPTPPPAPAAPVASPPPAVAPSHPQTPATPPPAAIPPAAPAAIRREDYVGPAGSSGGKIPVITSSDKRGGEQRKRPDGDRPQKSKGPGLKLAPIPTSATPPPSAEPEAPKVQKPDLKLPVDAIRASKLGAKPLSEHLRKHEERKKAKDKEDSTRTRTPAAAASGAGTVHPRRAGLGKKTTQGEEGGGVFDEPFEKGLGGREARQLKRKRTSSRNRRPEDDDGGDARYNTHLRRVGTNTAAPRKSAVVVELPCTVRAFAEALGIPVKTVQARLVGMGVMLPITATLNEEMAELLAAELGVQVRFKQQVDIEQEIIQQAEEEETDKDKLLPRPPVITFLGHVDHGKTSLLDKIIGINVVAGESGGITQHIRAYRIEKDSRPIVFVDTPGHEAFTEMRARGANVTDIAVLVVAANDGVMPQTEEALSHARAAEVPIVVALNKIDLPNINIDRVFQQLAGVDLLPAAWGGTTEVVQTSAMSGKGMDELLETLLTIAELHEFKANPERKATGTCLEAQLHEGRGVVAKIIVQNGTLKVGDTLVCGEAVGRVKALYDTLKPGVTYEEVGPSTPVDMTGFDVAPGAGDHFYVVDDIAQAREVANKRAEQTRQAARAGAAQHVTLENLFDRLADKKVRTLNLILRADVRGSIEAIQKELSKLDHPEVQLRVRQATVGGITEADVYLADATDAIIIGFNVVPDEKARGLAQDRGVQIRRYDVIYKLTEDIKKALEGLLQPEQRDVELGRALVLRTFNISRVGTVAGCRVLQGTLERNSRARVIRENRIIGNYSLDSLKREKNDAREVREGLECGIKLANFNDLKEGDVLEVYKVEEVKRTFDS